MASRKKKDEPPIDRASRPKKRPFPVGPDGKTANQRLRDVLAKHSIIRSEAELLKACNQLAGHRADDEEQYISQQNLNNFLRDKDNLYGSRYLPALAEVLGVRAFWLQTGIGAQRSEADVLLEQLQELQQKKRRTDNS